MADVRVRLLAEPSLENDVSGISLQNKEFCAGSQPEFSTVNLGRGSIQVATCQPTQLVFSVS
jgi:hypothetical protein